MPSAFDVLDAAARAIRRVLAFACLSAAVAVVGLALAAQSSISGAKKDEFQTAAPYAILIDAESGTILFEKNADQPVPPSSMAKLMTAELVFREIKDGRLTLDQEFIISEDAWRRGGAPSRTASMFAPVHSRVRVQDLLYGLIVQSANDAAIALAQGIAGSEPKFAEMMNKRARELGLTNAHFANASGLPDPSMLVSVRDLAKLARHIIHTYPEFYSIYSEKEFTWNKIRQQNRNPLLAMNLGADGLKTGYTQEGGYGLVGSAVQNGLRLIVAINGLKTANERANEAKRLLEWGFKGFEMRPLFAEGQIIGEAKLFGGEESSVGLVASGAINLLVPRGSSEKVLARIVYVGPVRAPVEKAQPLGVLKVWRGDTMVLEVPLQTATSVQRGGLGRRALDAAAELLIGLVRRGISAIRSARIAL